MRVVEQAERAADTSWTTIHTGKSLGLQACPGRRSEAHHLLATVKGSTRAQVPSRADFYTPPVVSHAMLAIQQLASVKAVPFGGYSQAERQRIVMGQPELVEALELDPSQVSSEHAATSCTDAFACMRKLCCEFEPDMVSFAARLSHWSTESQGVIAQSALQENCVAALGVKGNFMFESATHRLVSTPLTWANMHDPAVMQALSIHLL